MHHFSAAAHPACRSYDVPRGWNQKSQKVWFGNRLAFACLAILFAAAYAQVIALLETPRRSKMAWLDAWAALKRLGFRESVVASCQLRPPYKKESVHISYLLDSDALEVKCPWA